MISSALLDQAFQECLMQNRTQHLSSPALPKMGDVVFQNAFLRDELPVSISADI
jgi:hypothetical protein